MKTTLDVLDVAKKPVPFMRTSRPGRRLRAIVVAGILLVGSGAQAATLTWGAAGAGGDGTWDANTTANWWNGAANVVWPNSGTDNDAVFAGTAGSVTNAAGGVTVNDLLFGTTGYILSGAGTITLNGTTPTFTLGAGITAAIGNNSATVLGGSAGLMKTGAGTLTLNGLAVHTFTGGLMVNRGLLALDFANLGTPTDLIDSGNALTLGAGTLSITGKSSGATSQTFANTTLDSGVSTVRLVQNGGTSVTVDFKTITHNTGGTVNFATTPTVAGPLIAKATNANNNNDNTAGIVGPWATAGNNWIQSDGSGSLRAYVGQTSQSEPNWTAVKNVLMAGSAYTLSANRALNTFKGGTVAAVTNNLANYNLTLSGLMLNNTVTIQQSAGGGNLVVGPMGSGYELIVSGSDNGTISAPIVNNAGGASALTCSGSGALTLSGSNTFTGGVTLNSGTLNINSTNALGGAAGTFVINGGAINNTSGTALTNANDNAQTWAGDFTFTGTTNLHLGAGAVTMTGTRQVTVSANTLTVGGAIGGAGYGLTKAGAGTLVLSGSGTYSGTTTVGAGVLAVGNNTALGDAAGSVIVANTARLELQNGVAVTGKTVTINGYGSIARGALTVAAGAAAEWAGPVLIGATGDSRVGAQANGTLTISGNISDGGGNILVVSADVTGGAVILKGTNSTYSGETQIVRGILRLGAGNALPKGSVLNVHSATSVPDGAVFDLNGFNQEVAGLTRGSTSGSATVTNSSGAQQSTLTVNNSGNYTYSGTLAGNVALVKNGEGLLTLSGASAYSGGTTINAGPFRLGAQAAATNAGPVAVSGGIYDLGGLSSVTNGAITMSSGAISNGTLTGSSYTFSGGTVYAGLAGSASLTNNGGTTVLAGTGTYAGNTTINAGSLQLNSAGAIGGTNITMSGTGDSALVLGNAVITGSGKDLTVKGPGVGGFFGALATAVGNTGTSEWQGGVTIVSATSTRIGSQGGTLKVSGNIGETVAGSELIIRNSNGGVTHLSGTNTYTGQTTVFIGRLQVSGGSAILDSGVVNVANTAGNIFNVVGSETIGALKGGGTTTAKVTIDGGQVLTLSGGTQTFAGVIEGGGGLTVNGAIQGLTGTNTYTGATAVGAGTLQIDGELAGTSGVTISNGATLKGSGKVAGLITVLEGGTLSPGSSPGVLTVSNGVSLASTATFAVELWATNNFDTLRMAGGGALNLGGASLSVDVNGATYDPGALFTIVEDYGSLVGGFGNLTGGTITSGGNMFEVDYAGGTGNDITLTVVPEPGTVGLIGLIGFAAHFRRRLRG